MYVTRVAWAAHMDKDHEGLQVWECILCDLSEQFFDIPSLGSHLSNQHSGAVKDVEAFAAAGVTKASPRILSCPLCSWAENQTEALDTANLMDHIAEHVHSFSLRSLPWASTIDGTNEETESKSAADIDFWLSNASSTQESLHASQNESTYTRASSEEPPKDIVLHINQLLATALDMTIHPCEQNPQRTDGDYFKSHQYFGENAEDSIVASAQPDDRSGAYSDLSSLDHKSIDRQPAYHKSVAALLIFWKENAPSDGIIDRSEEVLSVLVSQCVYLLMLN